MMRTKSLTLILSAMLAIGLAGCGDNNGSSDEQNPSDVITPDTKACSGDECTEKQKDADAKMASCDFAAAYEALDSIYAGQVKDNKIEAQTALDRSLLGIIHIFYRKDVQAILPKLGFIAKSGLVDFKPLWEGDKGLFKQVFTGIHDYEDFSERIPMTIFKDSEDDVEWIDTIDKSLTVDEILDVLVSLKPELESLASSFEEAAKLTGKTAISPSEKIGCGLNNFKVDAADLNTFAAFLLAADALIDMLSHYDFNFSIYEYASNVSSEESVQPISQCYVEFNSDNEVIDDSCKDVFNLDYKSLSCSLPMNEDGGSTIYCITSNEDASKSRHSCTVDFDSSGKVKDDSCKDDYSLDYKTLFCGQRGDDEPYLECFVPNESDDYKMKEKVANLLIPHLFRATQSKRQSAGVDGVTAFKKAAERFQEALGSDAKGAFFDFSKIPDGARKDMTDIAKEMASGNGDLSKFIKPNLKVDLKKVFSDVLYAKDGDIQIDVTEDDVSTYGKDWIGDFLPSIYGDEIFLNEKLPNYIFNDNIISDDIYYGEGIDYIEIEFIADEKYDASFSSAWDDFSVDAWLNPNEYFGSLCEDDEECEAKCPDPAKPVYHKDASNPNGFVCDGCWDKCDGDTPYCVENILDKRSYCISQPSCAEGEQPLEVYDLNPDIGYLKITHECTKVEGYQSEIYCRDEDYNYPNGRYVFYEKDTKEYVCKQCSERCGDDKPYCVAMNPEYEYSEYVCSNVETCPTGYSHASNGECLPQEGAVCPDELKTKDICFDNKSDSPDDKSTTLYYCDAYGKVRISHSYNSKCAEIDISAYQTGRDKISVVVDDYSICDEDSVEYVCAETSDYKEAVSLRGCFKTTDGSSVSLDLSSRDIYVQICTGEQYCSYSSELEHLACIEPQQDPEEY